MSETKKLMEQATRMVEENLPQCCEELLEWSNTSILRDGVVRQIAKIIESVDSHRNLQIVENLVHYAAMRRVMGMPAHEESPKRSRAHSIST